MKTISTQRLNYSQLRTHNEIAKIMADNFGIPQIDTENPFHRGIYLGLCDAYEAGLNRAQEILAPQGVSLVIETKAVLTLSDAHA